eukprot:TRINITY_DN25080_c0_g1_i1.p1 TRINITY_DN25080_c0_g1~~TRINITY_DN25080_c0_g1_i1.p1  ORF type:complete len:413 (+),score=72.91 TRINITY_DN25080_c0_g1_i1:84-1322(+)
MIRSFGLLLLPLLIFTGSGHSMDSSLRSKVISDLSHGVFNFNFKLFNQIKKDDKNGVFSGFSLATILSMTSLGAKGKTLKEIRVALGLPTSKKQVKQAYSSITRGLTSTSLGDGNVTLEIANGVFPQKNFKITSFFLKVSKNHFQAQVKPLNYGSPAVAVQEINSWVDGVTHNKIKDLFSKDSVDRSTVCVFVNAIYFKGAWKRRFEARHTSNRDFHLASGSTIQVPTMHAPNMEIASAYIDSIESEIILFPYKGERFSMYILLPDEKLGLSGLEDKLDSGDLDPNVLDTINFESKRPVYLPKFKLSSSYDLKEGLQSIGIRRLFNHKADLSGIAGIRGDLYISTAVQKATIEVNEEGSEAAAASGMVMMMRSMPLPPTPVIIDRPFLFLIRDSESGMIVFSGRVLNPLEST